LTFIPIFFQILHKVLCRTYSALQYINWSLAQKIQINWEIILKIKVKGFF